jgi:hypothetical protein
VNKSIPYILGGFGVLILLLSFAQVRTFLKIPMPAGVTDLYLMIAGAVLVVAGVIIMTKFSKPEQPKEIPIYEGTGKERKVVAIQRVSKE